MTTISSKLNTYITYPKQKKLYKNDKNRFYTDINGNKKKRDLEEFMSDELASYALKREQPASLRAKMRGWMERMYSTIKQVFFGNDSLNTNDIKNLLGEKVFKGFATSKDLKASSIARFKYANVDELAGGIKRDFDRLISDSTADPIEIDDVSKSRLSKTNLELLIPFSVYSSKFT